MHPCCSANADKNASGEIIPRQGLRVTVLVLLVVADERSVLVPQGDHVDVLVLFLVVVGIDEIVLRAGGKPVHDHLDHLVGVGVVAVGKAPAHQCGPAVLGIAADGGRVHVEDGMVQTAKDNGSSVLIEDAFKIGVQVHVNDSFPWRGLPALSYPAHQTA